MERECAQAFIVHKLNSLQLNEFNQWKGSKLSSVNIFSEFDGTSENYFIISHQKVSSFFLLRDNMLMSES